MKNYLIRKVVKQKLEELKEDPDRYFYGYWVAVARGLNRSRQRVEQIKKELLEGEIKNGKGAKIIRGT